MPNEIGGAEIKRSLFSRGGGDKEIVESVTMKAVGGGGSNVRKMEKGGGNVETHKRASLYCLGSKRTPTALIDWESHSPRKQSRGKRITPDLELYFPELPCRPKKALWQQGRGKRGKDVTTSSRSLE